MSYVEAFGKELQENKRDLESLLREGATKSRGSKSPIKKFDRVLEFRLDDLRNIRHILSRAVRAKEKKRKTRIL